MGRVLRAQKELTRSRCSQRTPGLGQDTRLHGHQCASGWCCTGEAQAAWGQCGWRARGCEAFAEEAMLHLFLAGEGTGQVLPKQEREGGNGHSRLTTAEGSGATGYVNQNRDAQRSGGKRVGREASGGKGEKAHHTTPRHPGAFPHRVSTALEEAGGKRGCHSRRERDDLHLSPSAGKGKLGRPVDRHGPPPAWSLGEEQLRVRNQARWQDD